MIETESETISSPKRQRTDSIDKTALFRAQNFLRNTSKLSSTPFVNIHKALNPCLKTQPEEPIVESKYVLTSHTMNRLRSTGITVLTLDNTATRVFVGFRKGYFEVYNAFSFVQYPEYKLPVDLKFKSPIREIFGKGFSGFYVVVKNVIIEYDFDDTDYKFTYKTNTRTEAILDQRTPPIVVDCIGNCYELDQTIPNKEDPNDVTQRNFMLNSKVNIGRIGQVIPLNVSHFEATLALVQFEHRIGIVDFYHWPIITVWNQRTGLLNGDSNEIQIRCASHKFYYASVERANSTSSKMIYYNDLETLAISEADNKLEVISGPIYNFDIFNELLVAVTIAQRVEVFSLVSHHLLFEIDVGVSLRKAIIYKNAVVILGREGQLISRLLTGSHHKCCDHCKYMFTPGERFRICKHFLPERPAILKQLP